MSYNLKFRLRFSYIRNQAIPNCLVRMEARVVIPNIDPSKIGYRNKHFQIILHFRL